MTMPSPEEQFATLARIRALNDQLRTTLSGGQVMLTTGILALTEVQKSAVMRAVVQFSDFSIINDVYGEHDFGSIEIGEVKVMWKIDYYDLKMQYASPDPSDPDVTRRVMTVMLAEEY
jgi:hypothetical protein